MPSPDNGVGTTGVMSRPGIEPGTYGLKVPARLDTTRHRSRSSLRLVREAAQGVASITSETESFRVRVPLLVPL